METFKQWHEGSYLPWKEERLLLEGENARDREILKRHTDAIKHMVALLLQKKEEEAVKVWNYLELSPSLKALKLVEEEDVLKMVTVAGEEKTLPLGVVLQFLQSIIESEKQGEGRS